MRAQQRRRTAPLARAGKPHELFLHARLLRPICSILNRTLFPPLLWFVFSLLGIRELMARAGRLRGPFLPPPSRCPIAHGEVLQHRRELTSDRARKAKVMTFIFLTEAERTDACPKELRCPSLLDSLGEWGYLLLSQLGEYWKWTNRPDYCRACSTC